MLKPHWVQCCATSFGRQASDNHSASDAEHARFARESAATAIESRMYLLTDVCGTFEALTQRIQMYRDVADAKSSSPKHYVDDNDLVALAMYTQRSLYIVFYGNFNVRVICGDAVSAVPDVQQLSAGPDFFTRVCTTKFSSEKITYLRTPRVTAPSGPKRTLVPQFH